VKDLDALRSKLNPNGIALDASDAQCVDQETSLSQADSTDQVSDRVKSLRSRIANGTYQVESARVADKLIERMLRRSSRDNLDGGAILDSEGPDPDD